ncbi:unnamed protein product, partial [Mesorhabditis spiculigera]
MAAPHHSQQLQPAAPQQAGIAGAADGKPLQCSPQHQSNPSQYISVSPLFLQFDGPKEATAELTIKALAPYNYRLAWRVLVTSPTRYLVSPSTGFLMPNQQVKVTVTLPDVKKYHKRHRFLVQAIVCPDALNNRREVWKEIGDGVGRITEIQCIRVATHRGGLPATSPSTPTGEQAPITDGRSTPTTSQTGVVQDEPLVTHMAPPDPVVDEALNHEVNLFVDRITEALGKKQDAACRMQRSVNEIKLLEVELDRLSAAQISLNVHIKATVQDTAGMALLRGIHHESS